VEKKATIIVAIVLLVVIIVSAFSYVQQRPGGKSGGLFTLRPNFFTLPYTYFNFPSSRPSQELAPFSSNSLLGNYTDINVTINYSDLQINASSSNTYAFNIVGEREKEGSGPIVISGYLRNSSGWFAQSSFNDNGEQKITKTVMVRPLSYATTDQLIIGNNQLTIKQQGITMIDAYNLPPNFYVDGALSGGPFNGWVGGNVYAIVTGTVPSDSVEAAMISGLGATPTSLNALNLDGDLKANLSTVQRNLIWKGKQLNEVRDWFSGDEGASTVALDYNFSASQSPFGICDITFDGASGNRPFPYMSYSNYAIPKIYYGNAANLEVHFDIRMLNFTTQDNMRTAVVVELIDKFGHPYYFEQDVKDGPNEMMPYLNSEIGVWEQVYADVSVGQWVHFDIPFNSFIDAYAPQIAKDCFIGAFYLVNECFGSGYVRYDIANWRLTV
jgi:hypothetical protein